jgi:crotonobetainyl-CoA:carnitine CoA-transferase CaiB-like acyl-CoA transferase
VRVLDFSRVYAGPTCGSLLATLGAEVTKVESNALLDTTRRRRPGDQLGPAGDMAVARPYELMNHNKLAITVNLQEPAGRALVLRLVAGCDVVIEAFRPGVMARLGLDYPHLREVRPDLVMLSISGNGQDGPEARYASYAAIFAALGGVSYLTGYRGGMPTEYRGSADLRVGIAAFFACAAALERRRRSGFGGYIDLAGREVMSSLIGELIVHCAATGSVAEPVGNEESIMAPHGVFRTRDPDTWIVLAVGTQDEWERFCGGLSMDELAGDPRFGDGFLRWKNREALHACVAARVESEDGAALVERLQVNGVAASLCARIDHLLADEHLSARAAFFHNGFESLGPVTLPALPWKIESLPAYYRFAPGGRVGEHNRYVFQSVLGLSDEEYAALAAGGALA